jgi:putative ABC transport system permease protein
MKSFFRRLGWLASQRGKETELEEELQFHLEEEAGERRAEGVSPDVARMAARRELGNVALLKEDTRALWTWTFWEHLKQDLRSGSRLLRAHPGFTAVAVISLAVGIGANTAMFSMADAILFHPLPVDRPQEIVRVLSTARGDNSGALSYLDLVDFQSQGRSLSGLTAFAHTLVGLRPRSSAAPQVKLGAMVPTNFFDVLGVKPQAGRGFRADEDRQQVCVLGDRLWRSHFGADPNVVGQTIRLSNLDFTVIGVAPASFVGLAQFVHEELYLPIGMWPRIAVNGDSPAEHRDRRDLIAYGRLMPGRTVREANAEFEAIARNLERAYPDADQGRKVVVLNEIAAREQLDPTVAPLAILLLSIAGLVLLIACANVANLLLSRAGARSREVAIRLAIGAGKARLMRQFLTESLLLVGLGGVAGLAIAMAAMSYLSSLRLPTELPIGLLVPLDLRVLLFCAATSLVSGLVFGVAPAWQMLKTDLTGTLKSGDLAMRTGKRRFHARNLLVTGQVAVSTLLLVLAGLFVKDFVGAMHVDPGFRTDHVLLMALDPAAVRYNEAQSREFYKELLGRVRALPGVRSAALAQNVPLGFSHSSRTVKVEGYEMQRDQQGFPLPVNTIDENYLPLMQIPLVAGRNFDSRDSASAPPVVIINQTMAQRFWPKRSALGGRIQCDGKTMQVIGIARDIKYNDVSESPIPFFFLPFSQQYTASMTLHVETTGEPGAQAGPVSAEIRRMDPDQPVMEVNTLERFFKDVALFDGRLVAQLVTVIGMFGSVLAAIGLYGVIAYSVSLRTREIGIRVAIGADHSDVLRVFLRQGAVFTAIGVGVGLALALALSPVIGSQLVDHNPRDPVVFTAVPVLLAAVSLLASFVPARRAARIDPLSALRHE